MDNFWQGFFKQAGDEKEMVDKDGRKHVAAIAVIHKGKLLMGKRRDNNLWTQPGGHLNEGEDPTSGAIRELREETGMNAASMEHMSSEKVTTKTGQKYVIHAFKAKVKNPSTSMQDDPDQEVYRWQWVNYKEGLNKEIMENLHVPFDKNLIFKVLDVKKPETKTASPSPLAMALMSSTDDVIRFGNMVQRQREKETQPKKQVPSTSHRRNH